jgi:hypothetical protein
MYVEGTVLNTKGEPIPNAIIDTWESDGDGKYDNQVRSVYSASSYYLHADPLTVSMKFELNQTVVADSFLMRQGNMPTEPWCTFFP